VAIHNNRTERALRGMVLGRKNHYGSRSEAGTRAAAALYSLVESAKLLHLAPLPRGRSDVAFRPERAVRTIRPERAVRTIQARRFRGRETLG
jgi:hypothetical protein